jgi:hypothetical protein
MNDQNQNVIPGAWRNDKVLLDVYHERARNTGIQEGRQIRRYLGQYFESKFQQQPLLLHTHFALSYNAICGNNLFIITMLVSVFILLSLLCWNNYMIILSCHGTKPAFEVK